MGGLTSHKRAAGFFLAVILLLAAFCGWVVTDPAFQDNRDGRALITRWNEAVSSRIGRVYDIYRNRTGKKKAAAKKSTAAKPKTVVGPGSVMVQDNRNRPIKDVTVIFKETRTRKITKDKTSGSGRVNVKLPVGEYQIAFSHGKYSSEVRSNQRVAGPDKGFFVSVTLETRVLVKGVVVNEEGKPVAGASVTGGRNWLQQFSETGQVFLDDAAYPTVATDAKGQFRLEDVSIGQNTFAASMGGYKAIESRVEIPAGGLTKDLKLVLKRPAEVSGRVVDEEMNPVKGVKITAVSYQPYGQPAMPLPASGFTITTDAEGRFQLKKLFADGYYHLRFEHSAYAVMEQGNVVADTDGLTMVMQRGGSISGTVAYLDRASTAAHVLVQATAVVEGTTITRTTMSRGSGEYSFARLPYGSYRLSVDFDGFVNEPRGAVASAKDKPSVNNLVEIYEAATLSGSVIDAATGDTLPYSKVTVKASYGFSRTRVRQVQTTANEKGAFQLDELPGGTHQVMAQAEGYLPTSGIAADYTVPLDPGGALADYQIFLSRGGTVRGQVVTQDGQGVSDAEVQLYVASGSFSNLKSVEDLNMETDGSGFFEFSGFPIGQRLTLYASAYKDGWSKRHSDLIELSPQQPEMLTQVVLTPGGVLSGRVTNEDGVPLTSVKITYESREFPKDPSSSELETFTDAEGNFLIEYCTAGRATLVATRYDYVRQIRSVTVPEGRLLSRQNFKMELARNITGVVADFKGNPIAGAKVSAAPLKKVKGSGRTTTDKKGEFVVDGLGEGSFRLEATFDLDTPDGKQNYTFIVPEATAGAIGVPIDCDLAPTALGKVSGEGGKGLNNFSITLRSRLDTDPKQQFRFNLVRKYDKAKGFFRLLKVPRGLYKLTVEAPGHETWESEEVVIGPGIRTNLPAIRLKPASQIIGTVISATTGKPVHGALIRVLDDGKKETETVNRVELQGYSRTDILEYLDSAYDDDFKYDPDPMSRLVARVRANVVTTVQTNVYGKFDVADLSSGMYTIEIEHPSFRPNRITNITVGRDKVNDLGEIELLPGGIIRGRVVDNEGIGIPNASVQVKGELQGRNRDRTDVAGNFQLRGIGYGDWDVTVLATLNGRKVYTWKKVSVRPDETSLIEFVLETTANVNGRVMLPGGAATSGNVRLYVVDETGTVKHDVVYADALKNGNYGIAHIPPGRYFAVVYGQGQLGRFAFWQWVDANRGRNNVPLNGITASLGGSAVDVMSGNPVPGATITASVDVVGVIAPQQVQNFLKLSDFTDTAGRFTFPYLQGGTHRIWAAGPGGQLIPVDAISIAPGQAVTGFRVAVQGQ